ncbi:hypothetical protein [Ferrimonas senticii]|uniref:hypothetical protein n=1 Tax=Ferrimonas senticii TaxID=394566 RepID=UPI00041E1A79|nr:hypothetical protein [Ferrimonas senticii]
MTQPNNELQSLLQQRFKDAKSIAELRERLRDIEEELHAAFADELSGFADREKSDIDHHSY